jgi:hypothetical protein
VSCLIPSNRCLSLVFIFCLFSLDFYNYFLGTILYPKLLIQHSSDILESSFLLIELLLVLDEKELNSRLLGTLADCLDCLTDLNYSPLKSNQDNSLDIPSLVEASMIEKIKSSTSDNNSRLSILKALLQSLCRLNVGIFNSDRILLVCVKLLSVSESVDSRTLPLDCIIVHLETASKYVLKKVCL